MAKVVWSNGIDYVSGALNKVGKGQHNHEKMLIGTHRVAATTSKHCNRLYMREKPTRSTPLTNHERAIRLRFKTVAQMVIERKEDLTKVTQDQAAFLAQKDLANGKKTMRAYLWYICGQEYDQEQG